MALTPETRQRIFDKLKVHLDRCIPPLVVNKASEAENYELIGNKPVPYGYNKKIIPGMFFASLANRKDSVVLYFFPCYYNTGLKDVAPNLYKYLKGKTCFHFKKEDDVDEKELSALLNKGMDAWKKEGYIK